MIFKIQNLILVLLLTFFLAGCLELKTKIRIMPDGSGNCTMTIGQNVKGIGLVMKGMFGGNAMMGEGESEPASMTGGEVNHGVIDLEEIRERYKGIVAFGTPEEWEENGWKYVRYTAWFDDINEVRIYEKKKTGRDTREVTVQFSWKPEGDGHVLEIQGSTLFGADFSGGMEDLAAGDPSEENSSALEMPKEMQDMMAGLVGDASFEERFDLPGPVLNADAPFMPEGRAVSLTLSGEEVFDKDEKMIWAKKDHFRVVVGPTEISDDEVDAFTRDLRDAKENWKKDQDKFEAKAEAERVQTAMVRKERNEAIARGETVWAADLEGVSIPDHAVSGMIHEQAFVVEKATFQNGVLELRQGSDFFPDRSISIFLFLDDGQKPDGHSLSIDAGSDGFSQPHVHVAYKVEGRMLPKTEMFMDKYAMRLELGQSKNDRLPGRMYLCLPDEKKSVVAGMFEAEILESQEATTVDSEKKPGKTREDEKASDVVPDLLVPLGGAVMDNARADRKNNLLWEFDWADIPDVQMYKIQVWREGSESHVIDSVVTDSHYSHLAWDVVPEEDLQDWYWKVQAWVEGVGGSWSEVRSFSVETVGIDSLGLEKPTFTGGRKTTAVVRQEPPKEGVPQLLAPRAGAVLANGSKGGKGKYEWEFSWSRVAGATEYHLYVNGPKAKFPVINHNDLKQTTFVYSGGYVINQNRRNWHWKVRAFVNGEWGDWSQGRRFDVKPLK